jgi:hypothetical protein
MRAPVRAIAGSWPASWSARAPRLFRPDPRVLLEERPDADAFRDAMSIVHVGDTIKITGTARHGAADDLVQNLDLADAAIADIGVSDGSTAVDLAARLGAFGSYTLADLFLAIDAVQVGQRVLFFDPEGRCVLVAGRRLLGWPSLSRTVALLCAPLLLRARRRPRRPVLLLGPDARALVDGDPRVSARVHDVFETWRGPAPDLIKVANVLRRLYFSDEDIVRGLGALHDSLDEGGHLLMVDNPRIDGIPVRGGLYRRTGSTFTVVATTEHPPEIADLIASLDVRCSTGAPVVGRPAHLLEEPVT